MLFENWGMLKKKLLIKLFSLDIKRTTNLKKFINIYKKILSSDKFLIYYQKSSH